MALHAVTRRLLTCPAAATCVRTSTANHLLPQQQQRTFLVLAAVAGKTAPSQHPSIDPSCNELLKITLLHRPFSTAGSEGSSSSSSSSSKNHEPPHFKLILPDIGQSTKTGHVTTWRKEEGDLIKNGDVVCEVEMDQFNVGMEIDDKGFLARICTYGFDSFCQATFLRSFVSISSKPLSFHANPNVLPLVFAHKYSGTSRDARRAHR
jgi:hypothetical protein